MRKYPSDVCVVMRIWKWSKNGTQTTSPVSRRKNGARGQYPKLPLKHLNFNLLLVFRGSMLQMIKKEHRFDLEG